jgi:hypothetical protein
MSKLGSRIYNAVPYCCIGINVTISYGLPHLVIIVLIIIVERKVVDPHWRIRIRVLSDKNCKILQLKNPIFFYRKIAIFYP